MNHRWSAIRMLPSSFDIPPLAVLGRSIANTKKTSIQCAYGVIIFIATIFPPHINSKLYSATSFHSNCLTMNIPKDDITQSWKYVNIKQGYPKYQNDDWHVSVWCGCWQFNHNVIILASFTKMDENMSAYPFAIQNIIFFLPKLGTTHMQISVSRYGNSSFI